jgi:nucleoside-diphosphate-sugar epimerase
VPFKESDKEVPITAYGASKLAVTELLRALSRSNRFPSVTLRPTIAYGPGQDDSMFLPALIRALVEGRNFDMSLGEQTRDFIYVDDLVKAIIRALVTPGICGDVINISSASPIRIDALAKMTANMLGDETGKLLKFGAKDYRRADTMEYWASNTLAKRLLGWSPRVSLEEGVKQTISYFKAAAQ